MNVTTAIPTTADTDGANHRYMTAFDRGRGYSYNADYQIDKGLGIAPMYPDNEFTVASNQWSSDMSIQTITRQALFKKIAEAVNQLPNENLWQVWQQVDAWATAFAQADNDKNGANGTDKQEIVEFVVPPRLGERRPSIRLPMRSTAPVPVAIMEVGEVADDTDTFMQQLQANIAWWNRNYAQIQNDPTFVGRYVAVANGELFAGDSYMAAYQNARQLYPDSVPYIFYLKPTQEATDHAN